MYSKIANPKTGRMVSVNGKLGKEILRNYLNVLEGGSRQGLKFQGLREKFGRRAKKLLKPKTFKADQERAAAAAAAAEAAAAEEAAFAKFETELNDGGGKLDAATEIVNAQRRIIIDKYERKMNELKDKAADAIIQTPRGHPFGSPELCVPSMTQASCAGRCGAECEDLLRKEQEEMASIDMNKYNNALKAYHAIARTRPDILGNI